MSTIASFLRTKVPIVYFPIIRIIKYYKQLNIPYTIFITDSLGGSFKTYIKKHSLEELKNTLAGNLDQESRQIVDVICQRFLHYPDESSKIEINKKDSIIGGLLPIELPESRKKIELQLKEIEKKYKLQKKHIEASVFYYYHGLSFLSPSLIKYIKEEDFVDLGAYIGDSAIALNAFDYRKIYSIEISKNSINAYKDNLKKVGIASNKYEIINVAISANDDLAVIELPDTGSAGFSLMRKRGKYDIIKIHQKSFDTIVKEHEIKPKFIKVDIEGYAMNFVKGALKSIKKYRPVLSIAIYHNPIEFFEIKPLLESELPNYGFIIRKLTPHIKNNLCHSEVILLAYPLDL